MAAAPSPLAPSVIPWLTALGSSLTQSGAVSAPGPAPAPGSPQARAPPALPARTHGSIAAPRAPRRHLLRAPPWHSPRLPRASPRARHAAPRASRPRRAPAAGELGGGGRGEGGRLRRARGDTRPRSTALPSAAGAKSQ